MVVILGSAALGWVTLGSAARAEDRPVVVELFTSQGCSSCPGADEYLGELAKRPGVLALSMHVDYWNYIGWEDPFSRPEFTKRQQHYAGLLGERNIYTPQMVIDGRFEGIGSRREHISSLIAKAGEHRETVPIILNRSGDRLDIRVGGDDLSATMESLFLLKIDRHHQTEIRRGENTGKILHNFNVVRGMRHLGYWKGGVMELTVSLGGTGEDTGGDMAAVLLQNTDRGNIIGAQVIDLK